ncbi:MAG TPA: serine/threonine-protein kinase [Thermoanaerobaculia bacterium]|jgi:serine/threonine-protein kinase
MTTPAPDPDATARVDSAARYTPRDRGDDAQFAPGTMIAGRYRIASILGSGGMGEVYRADDTKLGQTVALKFLPARLARDPILLDRLHDEVRLGRQIAHPNVCRLYDIVDWDGAHFVAMEYVDGEDLSRLLKRIGRLSHDKAVDIARGIAAGLSAAHAKGILHRDLKPANVMVDSNGEARIMDFGLALAAGEDDGTISGTPAYMAPEQLAGEQATVQSDLYAVGLIMYELFTGKRAHSARTLPERLRDAGSEITTPSSVIRDIDSTVERVILRCLSNDADDRPRSARELIQALPGGDPLAAAVAAGETPSPRAVAAAGIAGSLRPAVAWALFLPIVGIIAVFFIATVRTRYWQRSGMTRAPEVAADRASDVLRRIGVPAQPFRSFGYTDDDKRIEWLRRRERKRLADLEGAPRLRFWMREEPAPLIDRGIGHTPEPALHQPPQGAPGSVAVELDPGGRLLALTAYATGDWKAQPSDWSALLRAAGLEPASLTAAAPSLVPPAFADARVAWSGRHPDDGTPIRVEAAAFRGVPVFFRMVMPWDATNAGDPFGAGGGFQRFGILLMVLTVTVGVVLAWRNLRQRRGDRQGAMRVAAVLFMVTFLGHIAVADHEVHAGHELELLVVTLAHGLLIAAVFSLAYLAIEPFIRRRWPQGLISWARLVSGDWRDPMIGRDIMIGFVGGLVHALIASGLPFGATPFRTGLPSNFTTALQPLGLVASAVQGSIMFGLMQMIVLMLFMIVLRRRLFAAMGVFALFMAAYSRVSTEPSQMAAFIILALVLTIVVARYGLLAACAAHASFVAYFQFSMPDALDWYTLRAIVPAVVFLVIAAWAFRTSLGGQRAFAGTLDD